MIGLILCGGFLGAILLGVFTVRRVTVVGANLPSAQIEQMANVDGENIFTVRSDEVAARVGQLPSVDVTRVDTSFPDTVTIYASLRDASIAWRNANGLFLIDRYGVSLGPTASSSLPTVAGGNAPPSRGIVEAVRYAAQTLPGAPGGKSATFAIDPQIGLTITGQSGWKADVGNGDRQTMVQRVATLVAILKQLGDRTASLAYVDVRYREPYFKMK